MAAWGTPLKSLSDCLSYYNGGYGREITLFGVTFFWAHKGSKRLGRGIGRLSWERF